MEEKEETSEKPLGNLRPDLSIPFSKDNQPTPTQKSAGWAKKRALKELLNLALSGEDEMSEKARQYLAKFLKMEPDDIKKMTVEEVMDLRQIHRAFNNGQDWKRIKDVVYGEKHDVTTGGEKINQVQTIVKFMFKDDKEEDF